MISPDIMTSKHISPFVKYLNYVIILLVLSLIILGSTTSTRALTIDMSGTLENASGSIETLTASVSIPNLTDDTSSTSFDVLRLMTGGDIAIIIGIFILILLKSFQIFQRNV